MVGSSGVAAAEAVALLHLAESLDRQGRSDEVGADLIVVGNKGIKGKGTFLGSVPNDIAHQAPCVMLVVRST